MTLLSFKGLEFWKWRGLLKEELHILKDLLVLLQKELNFEILVCLIQELLNFEILTGLVKDFLDFGYLEIGVRLQLDFSLFKELKEILWEDLLLEWISEILVSKQGWLWVSWEFILWEFMIKEFGRVKQVERQYFELKVISLFLKSIWGLWVESHSVPRIPQ